MKNKYLFFAILVMFFLYRFRNLFNPLTDFHSWRQTDTASVAYNFYVTDMNIFKPRLNVFPEIRELEFHIYPYIVAVFYKIFGFHEYFGRLISIFFGFWTIVFLYLMAKLLTNEKVALWSTAFFSVSPMAVYYNRTFMPESGMLFFTISGMYYFLKWVRENKITEYVLSIILLSLAFLTKITAIHVLFPIAYLLYSRSSKKLLSWVYIPLILILPFLWYYYSHQVYMSAVGGNSIWNIGTDKWFNKIILLTPDFYIRIFLQHLGELHFAYSGYLFFIVGLFSNLTKEQKFLRIWIIGVVIYFIVVAVGNYVHEYYQLPVLLPGSIFVGIGIEYLIQRYRLSIWLVILLVWLPVYGYTKSAERMRFDYNYKIAGERLAKVSSPNDKIIVVSDGEPEVLYYAKRKGWHFKWENLSKLNFSKYISSGAKYIIVLPEERKVNFNIKNIILPKFDQQQLIEINKLHNKFKMIVSAESFVIFSL